MEILVLFNLGLAHMAAPLLLHLPLVQAMESLPLLSSPPRKWPLSSRPLRLCHTHQKVQNISTSKLSLTPKALAMARLLSLMMGKPAWAEADHCKQIRF